MQQAGFILKLLLASGAVSIFIKYIGPTLSIPVTSNIALTFVFVPTLLTAVSLLWRLQSRS